MAWSPYNFGPSFDGWDIVKALIFYGALRFAWWLGGLKGAEE